MGLIKDWAKSRRMSDPVSGMLHVSACTTLDPDATSANYNLDGVISADGILPTAVNHSGLAKARKWPSPGMDLPVTVDRADPTSFRIEWDQVKTGDARGAAAAAALAARMRGTVTASPASADDVYPASSFGGTQVVDLRGMGDVRSEVLGAVSANMGDPEAMRTAIMSSLKNAGVDMGAMEAFATTHAMDLATGAVVPPVASAGHEDPAARLRNLDGLKEQGLVDDAEYARLRAQILEDV